MILAVDIGGTSVKLGLVNDHGHLSLTEEGKKVAEKVFERHTVLTAMLTALGVDRETASEDACRIEHVISEQTFEAIKQHIRQYQG
jgi:Mn-dependent DtxR family transcriptional regulator